jgi:hypothetical protein
MKQIPNYVIAREKRRACEFLSDEKSTPSQRDLSRRFMKQHAAQTNVAK